MLDGVDLRVRPGEVVSIVGPNGCGKSTLLRLLAGLLRPETGEIKIDGSPVSGPSSTVGLVFQEARLLPWRTLADNISFPLDLAGITTGMAVLDIGCGPRALVTDPAVLLLDEPFSALDALTRERLDVELLALWERTRTTIVLVTHSISEAVFLSDRVLVMSSRPGNVVADIRVEAPRPRHLGDVDSPALGATAARVREALSENTVLAA